MGGLLHRNSRCKKKVIKEYDLLDFQVIVPNSDVSGSGRAVRAANEYAKFASEATGASVGWLREKAFTDESKNIISIGETARLSEANFGLDISELGDSGYIVKSDENGNIYIIGGSVENGWMGLLCGVYDLLNEFFGYEYYADGVYSLSKNVTSAKFSSGDLDRKVLPSFAYRQRVYGFNSADSRDKEFNGYRLRMNRPYVCGFNGSDMHDLMYAIPYSEYGSAHPNWYMDGYNADGGQPCFTRDPDGIAEVVVKKMIPIVTAAENENAELKGLDKYFYVGMYDSKNWCECSSCTSYINAHGGYKVSTYIYFMNKVAARIRSVGRTDIKPVMLAYHATQDAPVKENSDGTLALISEDMKLDELVTVYYCPIEANYYVPFNYVGDAARSDAPSVKERNALALKSLKGWGMVAENVMYYFYMEHFPYHYMEFFDIFGSIQENFRVAADNGGTAMYNLGQFNESASTGFARLKEYVNAKLMWNVNENVDELIDGFFANYFGVASVQMRAIFDGQRAMIAEKFKTHPEYGDMSQYAKKQMSSDLFDKEKYVQWIKDFDSAYETVASAYNAGTITQAEKDRLNKAIKLESMSFRAVYIEYFTDGRSILSGDTTKKDFGYKTADMKTKWKSDADELGMTMWAEHETIAEHCKNW